MTKLNLGQDWSMSADAPNNRLIVEYEPNGTQFELNEDGTLSPLSGGIDVPNGGVTVGGTSVATTDDTFEVGIIDRAETFAESDVTVTNSNTEVNSNSVNLINTTAETINRGSDNSSTSDSRKAGLAINPDATIAELSITVSSQTSGVTEAYVYDPSETLLGSSSISGGSATITGLSLSAGTEYAVLVDDNGSSYTRGRNSNPSFPYTGTTFDIVGGIFDLGVASSTNSAYTIEEIAVVAEDGETSGSVTVEWDNSADVQSWDTAYFQSTPDGETVTVDIEESTDGGSTWTTIATDISRGADITASADSDVRLVANLSRTNTANNPTIDALYRRYNI